MFKRMLQLSLAWGLAIFTLAGFWNALDGQPARARGVDIFVYKQLGRSSPVVYVGEYITFTIHIRNDAAFTITTLPLHDHYDGAVLRYVDAHPVAPDEVNVADAQLNWHDLTAHFGNLAPSDEVWLTVGFIAEHPRTGIVNAAQVRDAEGEDGAASGGDSTVTDTVAIGGSAPVEKSLLADLNPHVGHALTFTIFITNQGYVTLTRVPLVDDYNPLWLEFSYADPPPDAVFTTTGVLSWTDVTSWTGPIPPFQAVTLTTVFTALATGEELMLNRAEVVGAGDWYGNDLDGGADEVPITIIPAPATPTPTPLPTPTPMPTPTPEPVTPEPATPEPVTPEPVTPEPPPPTATPFIVLLPETGHSGNSGSWWLLAAMLSVLAGGAALGARPRHL